MIAPELRDLAKTLRLEFAMHMNLGRDGHSYTWTIADADGKKIGAQYKRSTKKPRTVTMSYRLGDQDFSDVNDFLRAYQKQIDQEKAS